MDDSGGETRDRLLILPTRAAAAQFARSMRSQRPGDAATTRLPDIVTPGELVRTLGQRLPGGAAVLSDAEREVLLGIACRAAREAGHEPPFRLRPALVSEMLRFYDSLRRHQKDVDAFERLALGRLEPGADLDRGAQRLVRQTRFLAAAFRELERRAPALGSDEHHLRARLVAETSAVPVRHVVVAVGDQAFDPYGLCAADWDLLARLPGLQRLDMLTTDRALAGAPHERMHALLPGLEEVRIEPTSSGDPVLLVPEGGGVAHVARDREEEIAGFARRAKHAARDGLDPGRIALVVEQPLPYVYLAREVLRSGGVPCRIVDALPLAAEPYAAALDLVLAAIASGLARVPSIALMRSPHFTLTESSAAFGDARISSSDVTALDRRLAEAGYLGEAAALEGLLQRWTQERARERGAVLAGERLLAIARALDPLRTAAPIARHLSRLLEFLETHDRLPAPDDPLRSRLLRARGGVHDTLRALRDAYDRLDPEPASFDEVGVLVRRWIDGHTFEPATGGEGVHVVDAESARFGDFALVQLGGLVEGEWPARPRRNIFYASAILRDLGWPSESERREASRARVLDLVRLPASTVVLSAFRLEADVIVSPSPLLADLEAAALEVIEEPPREARIFEHEALAAEPVHLEALGSLARVWAEWRLEAPDRRHPRFHGATAPHTASAYSLSALERYQDCPFKFFAADVLRLEEEPEDESALSPRARGRFVHEVLQRFFEAWDARGGGAITPARLDAARHLFADVAEPLLARLPAADAALERARLFGSAVAVGIVDTVLGLEALRPADVRERWLEYRLEGRFRLGAANGRTVSPGAADGRTVSPGAADGRTVSPGAADGRTVSLRGVADRIDLLPGRRLRVFDYKTGSAPDTARALQVPVYALCALERLERRDEAAWSVDEAAYVALGARQVHVPVVKPGDAAAPEVLEAARSRLWQAVDGIEQGAFAVQPHSPALCRSCAFGTVCRKDYVDHA